MAKKLTDDDWIELSKARHPNKFTYERTKRVSKNTMLITCPIEGHGDFEVHMSKHTGRGDGCPMCSGRGGMNTERSIAKAKEVHGEKYKYDKYVFKNSHTKTFVFCPVENHGYWEVSPTSHIHRKSGCPECAGKIKGTKEGFTIKARNKHAVDYDYSKVVYVNDETKVEVVCKEHGSYWMKPTNHLQGQGCPKCAKFGYNITKPGYLYILTLDQETKIGITNREIYTRVKEINKGSEKTFKVATFISFSDGSIPLAIETQLLRELSNSYKQSNGSYTGSTECFLDVPYDQLLRRLTELCFLKLSN